MIRPLGLKSLFTLLLLGWLASSWAQEKRSYIVQLESWTTFDLWNDQFSLDPCLHDCEMKRVLSRRLKIYTVECPCESDLSGALSTLEGTGLAQVNHKHVMARDTSPDDGNWIAQWGMRQVEAPWAWELSTGGLTHSGDEIVIAVVDEGFDLQHSDLNFWKNPHEIPNDSIDNDGNGYVDDYDGWNVFDTSGVIATRDHGTFVSGIAGAIGNNQVGIAGVNWNAKIMPIEGLTTDEDYVVAAYSYIYEMRARYNETNGDSGAYVVVQNSSFGVDRGDPADYPIWCMMYDSLGKIGVLSTAATANANFDVDVMGDIPTTCPSDYLISVTSSNDDDNLSTSPPAARGAENIDIAAPGVSVYSTRSGGGYGSKSGTSYAAPFVAGAVGLMYSNMCSQTWDTLAKSPGDLALRVKDYLMMDGFDPVDELADKVVTGGRLNLYTAMQSAQNCFEVGQDEFEQPVSRIYPNPNRGSFKIEHPYEGRWHIDILDLNGRLIYQVDDAGRIADVNLFLDQGIYLLVGNDGNESYRRKFVVQE